jgi:endo-1,4-beta-xylanase
VRGHTLVWGGQLPAWVTERRHSRRQMLGILRRHVTREVRHFRGRVAEWDVVNEAVTQSGRPMRNVWQRKLGSSYIEEAFRAAHRADPRALLFYNDNGIDLPDHPHTVGVRGMLRRLKRQGVPVHGVGIQSHVTTTAFATEEQLLRTMRGFTRLGLRVAVTEMDVRTDPEAPAAAELERQRQVFEAAARACAREQGCTGFTTWGVGDLYSWWGYRAAPLMLDTDLLPKPAYRSVETALRQPPD